MTLLYSYSLNRPASQCTHSNHVTALKRVNTFICHTTMCRDVINFLYNPSHVTLWYLEVVPVVYVNICKQHGHYFCEATFLTLGGNHFFFISAPRSREMLYYPYLKSDIHLFYKKAYWLITISVTDWLIISLLILFYVILFSNIFCILVHYYTLCFIGSPCCCVSYVYYNYNPIWPYYTVIHRKWLECAMIPMNL